MAEEIINALTQVKGLRVAARTSCFAFKGKDLDAQTIAQRLRVNSLVEGSIRKLGNRIRLTAQLVDGSDGYQRWSQTYERTMDDVFALQEELAQAIVRELPLPCPGRAAAGEARNGEPGGVHPIHERAVFREQADAGGLRAATEYFEQAIALDPTSAPARSGLAGCLRCGDSRSSANCRPPGDADSEGSGTQGHRVLA